MTDNDIIKALECCMSDGECAACPVRTPGILQGCVDRLVASALDLIKRRQEEIERLKTEQENLVRNYKECAMEAVRDFAERLKARVKEAANEKPDGVRIYESEIDGIINELVAEMEGET